VNGTGHTPALLAESTGLLVWDERGTYVDATLGWGGQTEEILRRTAPAGRVVGIDRDGEALAATRRRLAAYAERLVLAQGNFAGLKRLLSGCGVETVQGVVFDLGLSSMQLDDPSRGFSYRQEGPLDMRMDRGERTTAGEILRTASEERLAGILFEYGEERWARKITKRIVLERQRRALRTTRDLAECILGAIPQKMAHKSLGRVFQALRIAVNRELEALQEGLGQALELLVPGGRLVVLSYHSLEDRIVKEMFRGSKALRILTKKPVRASAEEAARNPRAKSAKLRAAEVVKP
jgi:16S rRNA (cytosine1402-N4)-methyltransferase